MCLFLINMVTGVRKEALNPSILAIKLIAAKEIEVCGQKKPRMPNSFLSRRKKIIF